MGEIQFAFRIDNFDQLSCAFGPAVAHGAVEQIVRLLGNLLGDGGLIMRLRDGLVSASVWDAPVLGSGPVDRACARLVEAVSALVTPLSIIAEGDTVHVSVSGAWCAPGAPDVLHDTSVDADGAVAALARIPFAGEPAANTENWIRRYRSDMAEAVELFRALSHSAHFVRQPVRSSTDRRQVLYEECRLQLSSDSGPAPSASLAPGLERLGLIRALDHYVVSCVVEQLAHDPTVTLGAKISAQSATLDGLWVTIIGRLSRRPELARRLVIEVSEATRIQSIGGAGDFGRQMRRLGCRLALDGVGDGHLSIPQVLALKPDIVKTSGRLLQRTILSQQDRAEFRHLVEIATALAPVVVVEGAETRALSDIARESGAAWQQGCRLGPAAPVRTSDASAPARSASAG